MIRVLSALKLEQGLHHLLLGRLVEFVRRLAAVVAPVLVDWNAAFRRDPRWLRETTVHTIELEGGTTVDDLATDAEPSIVVRGAGFLAARLGLVTVGIQELLEEQDVLEPLAELALAADRHG